MPLNAGLLHCCQELVLRVDSDDMALPESFTQGLRT